MDKENKVRLTVTITVAMRKAVEDLASDNSRSFSQMAEILMRGGLLRFTPKRARRVA